MKELHCGLIGFPLVHSKSPEIHKALFSLSGRRYRYDMLEISPDKLESHVPDLEELDGFNITIPHKQSIIPYLSELDVSAGRYQAVNTVKVHRGRMVGYNTDVNGFLGALALAGIPLKGRVLICGAGARRPWLRRRRCGRAAGWWSPPGKAAQQRAGRWLVDWEAILSGIPGRRANLIC